MADEELLKIIWRGAAAWNDWREKNPELSRLDLYKAPLQGVSLQQANLQGAYLRGAYLQGASLQQAKLQGANLYRAYLREAHLGGAHLCKANLYRAHLYRADLRGAHLQGANLTWADLSGADLQGADLQGADLSGAQFVRTKLCDAILTGSCVYGASVWDIKANERTQQQNLIISRPGEPVITVDNLKVAQFIYLLLNNQEIRDVIDTITSKAVLILGRFSEERKPVLDAIRDELRKPEHNYLPMVFDFQPSTNQTTLETIKTLASMARFVIADLTDARSVLMELVAIVPNLPSVAVRLLIKKSAPEYGMLDFIRKFSSVVKGTCEYENVGELIASIKENIIIPAEAKVQELR
jgi:hypothetical protein